MSFTAKSALKHLGYKKETQDYILSLYNLPYRKYHNERHLDNMLRWVDPDYKHLRHLLESIIFHDVIYSDQLVAPGYNEAASVAIYAMKKATGEEDASDVLIPVQAINATAYHDRDQLFLGQVAKLTLDFDLQSFSRPRDEFLIDSDLVRQEFEPIVGEEAFLKGNKAFLEKLLKREKLYYIVSDWEERARANLEWRIKNMKVRP